MMDDNYIDNWVSQILKTESTAEGLVVISEAIYKISSEISKISAELAVKEEINMKVIENLQKQIYFLTKEIDEIKRT
ncbi:hypothetical protein ACIQ34_00130 [Ureibacillus sp. NPDC094379]